MSGYIQFLEYESVQGKLRILGLIPLKILDISLSLLHLCRTPFKHQYIFIKYIFHFHLPIIGIWFLLNYVKKHQLIAV